MNWETYAPIIVVVLLFIWQNRVFVTPGQLEKKHREILNDMKKNYVELNAYKESQTHIYSELEKVSTGIEDLKNYLMGKGTNHDREIVF